MAESLIETERKLYHQSLINDGVLTVTNGIASNADKSEKQSIYIAASICKQLGAGETKAKLSGQTLGKKFEILTCEFIKSTFPKMQGLRPGDWTVASAKGNAGIHISSFSQYAHLADLTRLLNENLALGSSLGNMYIVAPDIIVARKPCPDSVLNQKMNIVGNEAAALSPLRAKNNSDPILHASISAKWTMRSDRAQNSRTEALSLIRDRKGALPHIASAYHGCHWRTHAITDSIPCFGNRGY